MKIVSNIKNGYLTLCQKIGAAKVNPSRRQTQAMLFVLGVTLLAAGTADLSIAQAPGDYNDERVANSVNTIFTYLEGSFGALVMVVSGLGAIMSAAFGQYKSALGCLVVAVGAFILRSFMSTFFNVDGISDTSYQ
jgi:hypothetical protein